MSDCTATRSPGLIRASNLPTISTPPCPGLGPLTDGDTRKDEFVKADLYTDNVYAKYNIICVFDDRVSVVRFWRSIGLTVFQLDDREF
jgi:hypothetical protein